MARILMGVILFFITNTFTAFAQNEFMQIDYAEMERFVKDERIEYDLLLTRFEQGDPTLSKEEVAQIYYGFPFTDEYNSFALYMNIDKAYSKNDFATALPLIKQELKRNPLSLSLLIKAMTCSIALKDPDLQSFLENTSLRYQQIIQAILATGNGASTETAYKVICVSDEYEIIFKPLQAKSIQQQATLENKYDVFNVKLPTGKTKIFFDISISFRHLQQLQ
ncbi:DUF4919 domain-containing protein [Parabacteroides acidifaciens]|uniref:DUF4919 domain-containing protein n=1 Tax=Parabacteroides acidifaciens TaxID=2290935 RepID=A0A3D8HHP8_9BACT|nr:DUF4919 domain-containing protein [Parabacteroides acidifaciens]MBC8601150.1 DUF4919 domain-containing protein [Parabacteroides acidifaciens]RDU50212.1 DUF4919 domain-containing protein [Parabacteroides acidifaciens]